LAISLELLEISAFSFVWQRRFHYFLCTTHHHRARLLAMIVCSCNVLSDHDVRNAVSGGHSLLRNAKQLYGCLGCSAECGRCARTIKTIIDEALGPCAKACCAGCPHSRHTQEPSRADFALAAS
jgi:bacterioferritin-associated ferredoxin